MAGGEILYVPSRERTVSTNTWAFLHWLAAVRGVRLADWAAMLDWSAAAPEAFRAAMADFARLAANAGAAEIARAALLLLLLDIRPDDRLLAAGAPDLAADAARFTTVLAARGTPETLFEEAADQASSIVLAPASDLARALFRRPAGRHDLSALREVVALGGPLPANERTRLYTWVKADLMLIGLAGEIAWGDPLAPVLREPAARPVPGALLRRLPSGGRDGG